MEQRDSQRLVLFTHINSVKMKKIIIYTILAITAFDSFAQITIKGIVKDENKQPLIGATVILLDNTTVGTTTDVNGEYILTLKSNYEGKIQASYIGYTTQYKDIKVLKKHQQLYQKHKNNNGVIGSKENPIIINFELETLATNIDQVVITGTRTPKLLSEAPIQTRLITSEEIEKTAANNISDVLQQELPGVEFSYAMNQQVNMNLSGFSGQSVLFLIDGERLSGETMDNVDFQRLDMNNIERIEIVKGAASALYGSQAAGGVINIITKENTKKPVTINLTGRVGRKNKKKLGANIGFNKGIFHNTFSMQYTGIDTYEVPYNLENDFHSVYGGTTWNFKDKIIIKPLDNLKFTAHAGYFFRERLFNVDAPDRYRGFSGKLKGKWDINKSSDLEISYNFDQYDKSDYIKLTDKDIRDYSNVQNSVRGLYNHYIGNKDKTLTIGADFMYDYLYSYQFSDGAKKQNMADVFAQYDWDINKYWEIVVALRYDYFSDGNNNHLTPKFSVRFHQNYWTIRAGYGNGFRTPSLKEKYMDFDMVAIFNIRGYKDLKNENSHNFNLSGEYTYNIYNFTASTYYNIVQNRITTSAVKNDNDGTGNYIQYMNIEDMNVYGAELTAQIRFPLGLNAKLCYNYTKEDVKQVGTITPYAPARPHSLTARLDYDKQVNYHYGFNIAINTRFLSSIDSEKYDTKTNTSTKITYPAYMIWKLSFTQRCFKICKITLSIDNLLNYKPDIYYFNSPTSSGRTFFVDLSFDI